MSGALAGMFWCARCCVASSKPKPDHVCEGRAVTGSPSWAATDSDDLLIQIAGRRYRVTAVFSCDADANAYMTAHCDEGVIANHGPFVFLARLPDKGVKI